MKEKCGSNMNGHRRAVPCRAELREAVPADLPPPPLFVRCGAESRSAVLSRAVPCRAGPSRAAEPETDRVKVKERSSKAQLLTGLKEA